MNQLRETLEAKEKELVEFIELTKDDLTKKDETILDLESQAEDNMEVFQVWSRAIYEVGSVMSA